MISPGFSQQLEALANACATATSVSVGTSPMDMMITCQDNTPAAPLTLQVSALNPEILILGDYS